MTKRQFQWIAVYSVAVSALILVLGTAKAQVGVPTYTPGTEATTHDNNADEKQHRAMSKRAGCKASEMIGMDVRTAGGDEAVGEISDLFIHHNGHVGYAAVSFGGFLGMGDKLFAVPLEAIEFVKVGEGDDADVYARIDVSEQTLENRQGFDQDNWPTEADRSFLAGDQRVGLPVGSNVNR